MNASSSKTRIRRGAVSVIKRLRDAGFQAFLVGGAVRDKLLGRIPREYDIATEATPEQVMSIFARTVPVGAQFGVILVLDKDGEFEVATFRAEGKYSDGRRPDNISFVSAREDVLRRDFTINGLLEDPLTTSLTDEPIFKQNSFEPLAIQWNALPKTTFVYSGPSASRQLWALILKLKHLRRPLKWLNPSKMWLRSEFIKS